MSYHITEQVPAEIFRTYDIRGVADQAGQQLSPDVVYTIALAIGSQAIAQQQSKIIVARDGRLSADHLSQALIAGLQATGLQVIDIGQVPTGVLYFATNTLTTNSGVMLTASHNPKEFNGLKIVLAGKTLADQEIQQIYQRAQQQQFHFANGSYQQTDVLSAYINYIAGDVRLAEPMKIVVDCGNAIPGKVVPELFRKLGCDVTELFCEIDGNFPNHHPDPTISENLQHLIQTVKNTQADIGLGFDGDGDRLGVVTNQGEIINADRVLMYLVIDMLAKHPKSPIVYDVKCSSHLARVIREHQGQPHMTKTGHSLLKAKMLEMQAPLAGELSGHIFLNDERWFGFDDGLYVAARLLELLSQETQSVSEVFQRLPNSINTPEIKLYLPEAQKYAFVDTFIAQAEFPGAEKITIDGLRVEYKDGWGLFRASNTTPCITLRFEADNQAALEKIQAKFRENIQHLDPTLEVNF
jgi:phosphomannomutase/phosphoglucomutase